MGSAHHPDGRGGFVGVLHGLDERGFVRGGEDSCGLGPQPARPVLPLGHALPLLFKWPSWIARGVVSGAGSVLESECRESFCGCQAPGFHAVNETSLAQASPPLVFYESFAGFESGVMLIAPLTRFHPPKEY